MANVRRTVRAKDCRMVIDYPGKRLGLARLYDDATGNLVQEAPPPKATDRQVSQSRVF